MATERWRALGYTLLRWLCDAYAVGYYVLWALPKTAWLYYTGQLPPPSTEERWTNTNREGKF
jgi:hypothetical protein